MSFVIRRLLLFDELLILEVIDAHGPSGANSDFIGLRLGTTSTFGDDFVNAGDVLLVFMTTLPHWFEGVV